MINIIDIKNFSQNYPQQVEGSNEWFFCRRDSIGSCNDLYDSEEKFKRSGFFKGVVYDLIHFPDGKVYSPFKIEDNVYVDKPILNNKEFNFLIVDFNLGVIKISRYIPEEQKLEIIAEISLNEVENCYNLSLETTPLTLGSSKGDGFFQIVWPEKIKIKIQERESLNFRYQEKLYFSQWYEDEEDQYNENIIVRDVKTGEIIEKSKGYILKLSDDVYWKIGNI